MSKYIGKRVNYECGFCKKQFTLNKQSVDDSNNSGEVFCSKKCSEQFYLSEVIKSVCENCGKLINIKDDNVCDKCLYMFRG